ncbi:hypothetical protein [Glaciecola sp. 1036]|uniref:hypothetical protein n=1 Tax=Alteromonadaceae TaxID=72275 RepID=UPI003CFF3AEF
MGEKSNLQDEVKENFRDNVFSVLRNTFPSRERESLVEKQQDQNAHDIVAKNLQAYFSELSNTEQFSNKTITLFESLANIENSTDYRESLEKIMTTHDLISKRLDNAVEVDFKAYLPKKAPILYKDWKKKNKGKTALDCLHELYGDYLQLGVLFQDDLGGKEGLDPSLNAALKTYCAKHQLVLSDILPPKSARIEKLINKLDMNKAIFINNLYNKSRK